MTNKMPWFRTYSEMLSDRKIKSISRASRHKKVVVIGFWTTLLGMANDSPERGKLLISKNVPYTLDDYADETDLTREAVRKLLHLFREYNMVNGTDVIEISNWNKRQFKSDDSTKRVQAFRERQKETLQDTSNETLQKRCATVIDTESDTDKEVEEDRRETTPTPATSIPFTDPETAQAYTALQDHNSQNVAQLYTQVTGQIQPLSNNIDKAFHDLELVLDHYDTVDDAVDPGKHIYSMWCKRRGKTGKTYSPLNIAWIEKWLENLARDSEKAKVAKQRERKHKTQVDAGVDKLNKTLRL